MYSYIELPQLHGTVESAVRDKCEARCSINLFSLQMFSTVNLLKVYHQVLTFQKFYVVITSHLHFFARISEQTATLAV